MFVSITVHDYLENILDLYGIKMINLEKDFEKWWAEYIAEYFKTTGHMNMPLSEAARLGFFKGIEYARETLDKEYRWNGVVK